MQTALMFMKTHTLIDHYWFSDAKACMSEWISMIPRLYYMLFGTYCHSTIFRHPQCDEEPTQPNLTQREKCVFCAIHVDIGDNVWMWVSFGSRTINLIPNIP